jgi:hypothetical protein
MNQISSLEDVRRFFADFDRQHLKCPVDIRRRELQEAKKRERQAAREAREQQKQAANNWQSWWAA